VTNTSKKFFTTISLMRQIQKIVVSFIVCSSYRSQ